MATPPARSPNGGPDLRIMEDGGYRTIFVVPSRCFAIVRPGGIVPDQELAFLVVTEIRGLWRH